MSSSSQKSTNPFAITLLYYHLYVRSKLSADLLSKVAKKYKRSSAALLDDLVKKYKFPLPDSVNMSEIRRLVGVYGVPVDYIALMELAPSDTTYKPEFDVYSEKFDPEAAISSGTLFAPDLSVSAHDNMTRVTHLLPNYEGSKLPKVFPTSSSSSSYSAAEMISGDIGEGDTSKSTAPKRSCFDSIAELSSRSFRSHDLEGNAVNIDSPLCMLFNCMRDNVRVRIIIRRKGW